METQNKLILKYLQEHKRITPLDALREFGCFRLAARIYDLRSAGHSIITQYVTENDKTYAEYVLLTKA